VDTTRIAALLTILVSLKSIGSALSVQSTSRIPDFPGARIPWNDDAVNNDLLA
jgi:hypothetical protein